MFNLTTITQEPEFDGHLYKWKVGDCLASVALQYCKPSSDWKILYQLNVHLYQDRKNNIQEGDLLKIPKDWLPLNPSISYDRTKIDTRNGDLQRESYLLKMFGQVLTYKKDNSDEN